MAVPSCVRCTQRLVSYDQRRVQVARLEPVGGELSGTSSVKVFTGEDVNVHGLQEIQGVDYDCTCENEEDSAGALGLGMGLLFGVGYTEVIPKVKVTGFHFNQGTESVEVCLDMLSGEPGGVTIMKVED